MQVHQTAMEMGKEREDLPFIFVPPAAAEMVRYWQSQITKAASKYCQAMHLLCET